MRIQRISGLGCLVLGIVSLILVSLFFRVIGVLLFKTPIGLIILVWGIYSLYKRRGSRPKPIKYEVIDEELDLDTITEIEELLDDENS